MLNHTFRSSGDFDAGISNPLLLTPVKITGQFEALLSQIAVTITVDLSKTPAGAPHVHSKLCSAKIGYVDLNVRNTGIITDFFINALKGE